MDRLTGKHYDRGDYYMACSGSCANDDEMCGGCPWLEKIINRLGSYEDTGLEPEKIEKAMAISALREQEERENPKPLTLDELREMDGEPVWIKLFDPDEKFWVLRNEWVDTRNPEPMIMFHMRWYSHADYGKTWLAYRSKPKEAMKNE